MSAVAFVVYAIERFVPPNICDTEADRSADKLESTSEVSQTEALRHTVVHDLRQEARGAPLAERLQPLLDEIAAVPGTGHEADKAFDDGLGWDP